jgi:ASC-1-like (ASCH) protein
MRIQITHIIRLHHEHFEKIYTKEDEQKFGILGIKFELIK